MNKEIPSSFSTFLTNTGTPVEQLQRATGIASMEDLTDIMRSRSNTVNADLLLPTPCNQSCVGCFYDLPKCQDIPNVDVKTYSELQKTLDILRTIDPKPTYYPREPTVSSQILKGYKEANETRALTNGKLLYKSEIRAALKNTGITDIVVTVPGTENSYAVYTGENASTYERLLYGIKKATNEGIKVSVFMPIFQKNINDIEETTERLANRGVKEIRFIRVIPTGKAKNLPNDFFLTKEGMIQFLTNVNKTRIAWGNKMRLSLFGLSFGPNFFGTSAWRSLAGFRRGWPNSEYLCPTINRQYLGVVLGSKDIVTCFQAMSFPDQRIGYIENGKIVYTPEKPTRTPENLAKNLRGNCATENCAYQPICFGGCRTAPIAEAIRKNEPDPEYAGQTLCITNSLNTMLK